jgi:hypothetical protein
MTIDTGKVTGRREVHYTDFDEVLADAERLSAGAVRMLGNWTYGQILEHLAAVLEMSIDGFEVRAPWYVRVVAGLFLKRRYLSGSMPAGIRLTRRMSHLLPKESTVADGLAHLRHAIRRFQTEDQRAPHPVFTRLTKEEADQLQLRHCELHMSSVLPVPAAPA